MAAVPTSNRARPHSIGQSAISRALAHVPGKPLEHFLQGTRRLHHAAWLSLVDREMALLSEETPGQCTCSGNCVCRTLKHFETCEPTAASMYLVSMKRCARGHERRSMPQVCLRHFLFTGFQQACHVIQQILSGETTSIRPQMVQYIG